MVEATGIEREAGQPERAVLPRPRPRLPWELHPALTAKRLGIAAHLLARGRADAIALADRWAGDDAWSIGCRAYSFSRHQLSAAARTGEHPWLKVFDATHHFVFLVDGVPVRFFRGDADDPTRRTLRMQEAEAEQLALALGSEVEAEGLMFRLAVETGESGEVSRIVFLALRGEEGRTECFWPVPIGAPTITSTPLIRPRRNGTPAMQLPLPQSGVPALARAVRRARDR